MAACDCIRMTSGSERTDKRWEQRENSSVCPDEEFQLGSEMLQTNHGGPEGT